VLEERIEPYWFSLINKPIKQIMKKILFSGSLGLAMLVLSGCGGNKTQPSGQDAQSPTEKTQSSAVSAEEQVNLPAPTGKVDDTVNSIIEGANSEKAQAASDSEDAKSSVSDGQDTTNLSNSYDQNAF
jgi:predicted small secreted protein